MVKPIKKVSGAPNWVRNDGFCHFLKVASLFFLDIAQDCSLGPCATSSRAETWNLIEQKKNCSPNWGQNDLSCSNVVKHPLELACFIRSCSSS